MKHTKRQSLGRRVFLGVTIHLVIGAAVSILVAWLCAFLPSPSFTGVWLAPGNSLVADGDLPPQPERGPPTVPKPMWMRSIWLDSASVTESGERQEDDMHVVEQRQGFPFRCVREWSVSRGDSAAAYADQGRWTIIGTWPDGLHVPVSIMWPGFALNTLFYAAIAWGLWQVPLAIRRRGRRRRNRCVSCGYDRAGLGIGAACPECGTLVP